MKRLNTALSTIIVGTLGLASCNPFSREGIIFIAPEKTQATQVDENLKMHNCLLGKGSGKMTRDTFVHYAGESSISLTEIKVVNPGTCRSGKIFLTKKQIKGVQIIKQPELAETINDELCESGVFGTREGNIYSNTVIPFDTTTYWRNCGEKK